MSWKQYNIDTQLQGKHVAYRTPPVLVTLKVTCCLKPSWLSYLRKYINYSMFAYELESRHGL